MEALVADLPSGDDPAEDEQTLAEGDQTLADSDQTLSDTDQSSADSDQTSSDRDQFAADRDQAASDRDLARGADHGSHRFSRELRARSARQRGQTAETRLATAEQRDAGAATRDLAATARDQAAAVRDLAMTQRDQADSNGGRAITGTDILLRAADQRRRATRLRAEAAEYRVLAAADREAALHDRDHAAGERLQALADREALAHQLAIAETDAVTGVRTRAAGLTDLDHELDRCRRDGGDLVVVYIDVVGLKAVNDSEGHSAGDALLQRVVGAVRSQLRSYDLIVRLGGDEFLCALSNITLEDARGRFLTVVSKLASSGSAIRTGFAQLAPDDSGSDLIARADSELIAGR
jgi:diguanylate cyclase (GGDEF)-like protein